MKLNSLAKHYLSAGSLRLAAAAITSAGIVLAQTPPPPVPPSPDVHPPAKPVPPAPPPLAAPAPPPLAPLPAPVAPPTPTATAPVSGVTPPIVEKAPPVALARNILDETLDANPLSAAKNYEAIIASFDQQRETAAQAIFRLGESYRKMGRIDEARSMYARILREFVDFPDLAKLSQRLLTENAPTQSRGNYAPAKELPSPEEEQFIRQELALLEKELDTSEERIKAGMESRNSTLPLRREILQLQQRLARLRAQNTPTLTQSPELRAGSASIGSSSQTSRPSGVESESGRLKNEIKGLENLIALISNEGSPENISADTIRDKRFSELKGEYEKEFLRAPESGDKDFKGLANAQERLAKWVREIYLPELKNTLAVKKGQLETGNRIEAPVRR